MTADSKGRKRPRGPGPSPVDIAAPPESSGPDLDRRDRHAYFDVSSTWVRAMRQTRA
jgi:hypothetical protein